MYVGYVKMEIGRVGRSHIRLGPDGVAYERINPNKC